MTLFPRAIEYLKSVVFCLPPPLMQMASLTPGLSSGPQEAALPETVSPKPFLQSSLTKRSIEIIGVKLRDGNSSLSYPTLYGTAPIASAGKASRVGLCSMSHCSLGYRSTCLPLPSLARRSLWLPFLVSCWVLSFFLFANLTLLTLPQIFPSVISLFKTLRQEAHKPANEQM